MTIKKDGKEVTAEGIDSLLEKAKDMNKKPTKKGNEKKAKTPGTKEISKIKKW